LLVGKNVCELAAQILFLRGYSHNVDPRSATVSTLRWVDVQGKLLSQVGDQIEVS
jgi:hypothetical protein